MLLRHDAIYEKLHYYWCQEKVTMLSVSFWNLIMIGPKLVIFMGYVPMEQLQLDKIIWCVLHRYVPNSNVGQSVQFGQSSFLTSPTSWQSCAQFQLSSDCIISLVLGNLFDSNQHRFRACISCLVCMQSVKGIKLHLEVCFPWK